MTEKKSKLICYMLAFFFGGFGAHLFYTKKYKRGFLYLLFCWTYIPFILGWIDMFFINKWFEQEVINKKLHLSSGIDNKEKRVNTYKNCNDAEIKSEGFTQIKQELVNNKKFEVKEHKVNKEANQVLAFNSNEIKIKEDIDREHALRIAVQKLIIIIQKQIQIKLQEQNLNETARNDILNEVLMVDLIEEQTEVNSEKQFTVEYMTEENEANVFSIVEQKNINLVKEQTTINFQEENLIGDSNEFEDVNTKKQSANSSLFYKKEDIILDKYAHLKTPGNICTFLEGLNCKNNRDRQFVVYNSTFIKDSLKYANKRGVPCEFKSLFSYYTTFEDLDNEQLRWYFYWRERVLNEEYLDTDLSYIFLFIYELINYTFNDEAAFNISIIARIYENYKEKYPKLPNYINRWASDFLFELEQVDLAAEWSAIKEIECSPIYNKIIENIEELEKISFTLWKPYIQNFRETEFYKRNKRKVYSTFKQSIALLNSIYISQGINIIERWFFDKELIQSRYLFSGAVIDRPTKSIQYKIKSYNASEIMLSEIAALFRLSENVTRLNCGEKRQLKMEEGILPENFKDLLMDRIIPPKQKINERFKLVQSSNSNNYIDIPKQPKLEKEEDVPTITFNIDKIKLLNKQSEELQNAFREKGYDDDSDDSTISGVEKNTEDENIINVNTLFELDGEEEQEFINSLTKMEINFFNSFNNLKKSASETSAYCKQNSVMIGTFISGINEKANKYLDDNILEINDDYYIIYEDYESLVNIIRRTI